MKNNRNLKNTYDTQNLTLNNKRRSEFDRGKENLIIENKNLMVEFCVI